MADKIKPAIDYTSRDFTTIKGDLVDYAKRYYPNQFRDFSANSFGSLMLDTVAYVGDILSFYLDYQVNESFLDTAIEYNNVVKLAKQFGYNAALSPASYGTMTMFVLIPAENGAPNLDYAPIVKRGSKFSTGEGKIFTLLEDVNFEDNNKSEIVVGQVDATTGTPLTYAVRARGQAISGELAVETQTVGSYQKFRTIEIAAQNVTEIVSVTDSEGNTYYEVDYLTQNTIYVPLINRNADRKTVPNILKPIAVPRRFTTRKEKDKIVIQFGFGSNEDKESVVDPANVLLNQHGKEYITDSSFDPAALLKTDRLGISPSDTAITVVYRVNSSANTNAPVNSIVNIVDAEMDFKQPESLSAASLENVRGSLEVTNEEAFIGSNPFPDSAEIKERALGSLAMQSRIVTKQDFITACYNMPRNYGSIKKVNVAQDSDSFNQRNINIYVLSQDADGALLTANNTIKNNLKTFLMSHKMINDTIDILDAKIINLQIYFKIVAFSDANKFGALQVAKDDVASFFADRRNYDIGEPFSITDVYAVLKNSAPVLDVLEVQALVKSGGEYATTNFSIDQNMTADGRMIHCPLDHCFEVKFPNIDIIGEIL